MKKRLIIGMYLMVFVCSCEREPDNPPDTALSVSLSASNEIVQGEQFIVSIEIKNADSLFALSFELHYDSTLFKTDTIIAGDLFINPYLASNPNFLSDGEVPVAIGEDVDSIQKSASGTACSIIFTSENIGTDILYISSLHLIKKDSNDIDGFNTISVESIEVQITP